MGVELTDKLAREAAAPERGQRIVYDSKVVGLGLRVTAGGARAWIFNYHIGTRERRLTIGACRSWDVKAARRKAEEHRHQVDHGVDPQAADEAERNAPTVGELIERFEAEWLPRKREGTRDAYTRLLRNHIRPEFGSVKVAALDYGAISKWHGTLMRTKPYAANRALAVLSKMMSLAVRWGMRADNPCKGVERAQEEKRERFLTADEIGRLFAALDAHPERTSANAVRLMLLTGARKGETLAAEWSHFDLDAGVWTKPAHTTKTAKLHRVPLNEQALELLRGMRTEVDVADAKRAKMGLKPIENRWVFEGTRGHLLDVKRLWGAVCKAAELTGEQHARVHDLRHSYASILASSGLSLPVIGKLLGHTQAATTHRYAHLQDEALRAATERAGSAIAKAGGNVVLLKSTG